MSSSTASGKPKLFGDDDDTNYDGFGWSSFLENLTGLSYIWLLSYDIMGFCAFAIIFKLWRDYEEL